MRASDSVCVIVCLPVCVQWLVQYEAPALFDLETEAQVEAERYATREASRSLASRYHFDNVADADLRGDLDGFADSTMASERGGHATVALSQSASAYLHLCAMGRSTMRS